MEKKEFIFDEDKLLQDGIDVMSIFSKVEKMVEEYDGNQEVFVDLTSHHYIKKTASFMCINVSVGKKMEVIYFNPLTTKDDVDSFLEKVRTLCKPSKTITQ